MYQFTTLDPRNIPAATEANDKVFGLGPVYGIEVTVPALAARCVENIDPQHTGGNANRAAIEEAYSLLLAGKAPPKNAVLATVRADLDSVGAMAVLGFPTPEEMGVGMESDPYKQNCPMCSWDHYGYCNGLEARIDDIAASDKFARGGYAGPKPLPTRKNPWDEKTASAESSRPLAAIAAAVMDFKIPLADRVATMADWLLNGTEPSKYREAVEKERMDFIRALEAGEIQHEVRADGKVAVVESTHRAATSVGYSLAPVVVALNPAFKLGGGEAHRKFTVCAFEAGKFADIKSALAELASLEPGWGGSPTIGGSPQGVSSTLTIDQVVEVVAKHLR